MPPTVHASLLARFDRLGDSRGVAQLGATIGRDFTYRLIRAVADMSEDDLRGHLDRLCRSELAFLQGAPPHSTYTFKHALIQDAIYGTLLKKSRLQVHERVFSKLKEQFPEVIEARPEMAAYHAENAGLRESAVPLLKEAGMRAFARTAMAEAVKHLGRAIDLVDALEEPVRGSTESDLQAVIGPAYMATLGWAAPEVERSSARLRDLAANRGDGAKLFQAMWGLWTVQFLRGQLDPALDMAGQVLGMAIQTGDPMLTIAGHHAVGYTHLYRRQCAGVYAADECLLEIRPSSSKNATVIDLSALVELCHLVLSGSGATGPQGHAQQAAGSLHRAHELAEELRHAPSRAYLLCQMCNYFRLLEDVQEQVEKCALEMRSLATAEGFALWIPLADVFLAWTSSRQGGDAFLAAEKVEAALTLVHESRTYPERARSRVHTRRDPCWARGSAENLSSRTPPPGIARLGKLRHGEPELLRLQGDGARAIGDAKQAAGFYREGIESSRSTGSTPSRTTLRSGHGATRG